MPALPCRLLALGAALAALPALAARAELAFTDVTAEAGLVYQQSTSFLACRAAPVCEAAFMAGGAAVADVDGDGDTDLFATRIDAPNLLFANQGDGTFAEVAEAAALAGFDLQSNGAAFGDIDNDGDPDLYITTIGDAADAPNTRNYLFMNDGAGRFTEEALARGAAVQTTTSYRLSFSAAFGDYDRDGWLDLHVTEWFPTGAHTRLLRNRGAAAPGLAVAADFGTSHLFWNDGDGTFSDGTAAAGIGSDENGMGSSFGDYDGDGDLDWFVTSIWDPAETCETQRCSWGYTGNRLYRNEGNRVFSDATDEAGVRVGHWGWGAAFFDADNDGDQDLAMTNGVPFTTALGAAFAEDPARLWENDGSGGMREVSAAAGFTDTAPGKGLLSFDYDRDGDLDVFLVNNAGTPRLYRNDQRTRNAWLRVRTRGITSTREGWGAKVSIWVHDLDAPPQVREIGASTHFLGQSELVAHFGLGPGVRSVRKIRVEFPSGAGFERAVGRVRHEIVLVEPPSCGVGPELALLLGLAMARRRPRLRPR